MHNSNYLSNNSIKSIDANNFQFSFQFENELYISYFQQFYEIKLNRHSTGITSNDKKKTSKRTSNI